MESDSFYEIELKQPFNTEEENILLEKVSSFFAKQTEHSDVRNLTDEFQKLLSNQSLSGHYIYPTFSKYTATVFMRLNGHFKGAWLQVTLDKDLQE